MIQNFHSIRYLYETVWNLTWLTTILTCHDLIELYFDRKHRLIKKFFSLESFLHFTTERKQMLHANFRNLRSFYWFKIKDASFAGDEHGLRMDNVVIWRLWVDWDFKVSDQWCNSNLWLRYSKALSRTNSRSRSKREENSPFDETFDSAIFRWKAVWIELFWVHKIFGVRMQRSCRDEDDRAFFQE